MTAYYNEIEPYAAQWLRNLISKNLIAAGDVDERSIVDVHPDDLKNYTQCHFFAGIGGWSYAARLAGWPDERPLWTGSCPCQPFSSAGYELGSGDPRHLWPAFFKLIRAERPAVVMGEQVAAAVGKDWLDGVHSDLESIGYACGSAVVPACAVDAPHRRDRLWFVADAAGDRRKQGSADSARLPQRDQEEGSLRRTAFGGYNDRIHLVGADGKSRRLIDGVKLLDDGVPARVGRLRAYGNAIVPQVAAEVIAAYMEIAA